MINHWDNLSGIDRGKYQGGSHSDIESSYQDWLWIYADLSAYASVVPLQIIGFAAYCHDFRRFPVYFWNYPWKQLMIL